ncbi:hypothetical protein AMTRI_Chr01g111380 [Amborella trichopoda]
MEGASLSSGPQEASTYDEISMQQSLIFSDSLQDLKNLRAQLYSAAEHFELSYTNDNHKQTVVDTLKDFAVRALVNTVDHLGSVSYRVNGLLNEKVEEVSETEFRIGCMEQRVRMCQEYMDHEGLGEQSITITAPKYHKRYMLKGNLSNSGGGAKVAKPYQEFDRELDNHDRQIIHAASMKRREKSSSSRRKTHSLSPSPRPQGFYFTECEGPISPFSASRALVRSGSLAHRTTINASPFSSGRRFPLEPQKSASMRFYGDMEEEREVEHNRGRSKRFLRALLSRGRSVKHRQPLST